MDPIDNIKLKKRLIAAYQSNPEINIPAAWQATLMRKIRRIGPLNQEICLTISFQKMVWKIAPAFCILLAILISGIVSMDLSLQSWISESFIGDPVSVIYNGIFLG